MAVAAAQAPSTARPDARDDLTTGDEVKEYFHEGEGENEHFNSMDLHDIKTELEKDAEASDTNYSCSQNRSSSLTPPSPSPGNPPLQLRPTLLQPMLYANGFMIPHLSGSPGIYPVASAKRIRPIKMEQPSHPTEWVQSNHGMGIPYGYQPGIAPVEHGVRQSYPYMQYVTPLPYERQVAAFGAVASSCPTQSHSQVAVVPPKKEAKVHIKKPLNAFMLFMKKNRSGVIKQHTLKESAAINKILGQMWHKLTKSEQAVYYQMAQKEREKHMELYPGWSARDNYALRKNRKSKKPKPSTETAKPTEEIVFEPDSEDAQVPVNGQVETENKVEQL